MQPTHHPSDEPLDEPSANVWVECTCGERHWGRYGAAGLLLTTGEGEDREVLLQHRAGWTHQGDTWALPGGARGAGEDVETAALREAAEEAGLAADQVETTGRLVVDHGPWSYTYVLALTPERLHLTPSDAETQDLAWARLDEVTAYPLHPLFAQAWPALLERLRNS